MVRFVRGGTGIKTSTWFGPWQRSVKTMIDLNAFEQKKEESQKSSYFLLWLDSSCLVKCPIGGTFAKNGWLVNQAFFIEHNGPKTGLISSLFWVISRNVTRMYILEYFNLALLKIEFDYFCSKRYKIVPLCKNQVDVRQSSLQKRGASYLLFPVLCWWCETHNAAASQCKKSTKFLVPIPSWCVTITILLKMKNEEGEKWLGSSMPKKLMKNVESWEFFGRV